MPDWCLWIGFKVEQTILDLLVIYCYKEYVTPSNRIAAFRDVIEIKSGGSLIVVMDLFEITPAPRAGLFLEKYRLSWIAFLEENPNRRVLMDSHAPVGLHFHLDSGPQISVDLKTIEEALEFFEQKVIAHFGALEGGIYENFHV